MLIYKAERDIEGLAEKILANQSIAYHAELVPWAPSERESIQKKELSRSLAGVVARKGLSLGSVSDEDLFFTKSILVSTNWNKNDDVFSPEEVWAARHTPSHKPTNLEHDESRLVGHITETWALDVDGNLIADDTVIDDLPELYHIANGAVIYNNFQDSKLVERTSKLIAEINEGNKFVSMEALFTDFGYAIVTPENTNRVIARNKDTAFLTKHLRCYGGNGTFENCKIGRLLKNITFCGKGYVDKPANPHSVIFTEGSVFNCTDPATENLFFEESGVSFSCSSTSSKKQMENSSMSDNQSPDLLKSHNTEIKTLTEDLNTKSEDLVKAQARVEELEGDVDTLSKKLKVTESELGTAEASVKTLTAKNSELGDQLEKVTKERDGFEKEVTEAKVAKMKADRISYLVDSGVEKDAAVNKVEVFANLSDDQFKVIAEDIISAVKNKNSDDDDSDESDDPAETKATTKVLDNAQPDETQVSLTVASEGEEDEKATLREQLQSQIASRLGYKTN